MKNLFFNLLLFFPVVLGAQENWNNSFSVDSLWKKVGNEGFTTGAAWLTSLAFSPSGQPYVAFEDNANFHKASVMKFDGTSWVNVGNAGFSAGDAYWISLAFSPTDGQPYVAYEDYGTARKVTVMKFDGTNWVNVCTAGFSTEGAMYTSLAFNPVDGKPYVVYADGGNSNKATVMYSDASVGISELRSSKISIYPNPSSNLVTIETSATPVKGNLSIRNLNGQQIITRQITQPKTQLDISSLPSGVYLVKVVSENGVQVGKFIKL